MWSYDPISTECVNRGEMLKEEIQSFYKENFITGKFL